MNFDIIDTDYNWKQAATQEGVDYGAVQKSFMDQSYGVVANKAKILFQDPFRLGFEIVHRNEKATKMVGIFAFRVNKKLLYVPTFFVNGEIKAADMLYRADVKRFVPLTEDWCAYLVRGVEEHSGEVVDRNRQRQPDAYMDRLAYPQRVKFASEMSYADIQEKAEAETREYLDEKWAREMSEARAEFVKAAGDGSLFRGLMLHSADNSPLRKLLPEVISEVGPEALEKIASMVEDSPIATRYLATNYTREELENVSAWMTKEASEAGPQPAISIILSAGLAKSAAARDRVFDRGFDLVDHRPSASVNTVIEEIGSDTIKALAAPGKVNAMLNSGEMEEAFLLREDYDMFSDYEYGTHGHSKPDVVFFPKSKELLVLKGDLEVYGDEASDPDAEIPGLVAVKSLKSGKFYVAVRNKAVSPVFRFEDRAKDGASTCLTITDRWGSERKIHYSAGREAVKGEYISDETQFLEVKCDVELSEFGEKDRVRRLTLQCDKSLMSGSGIDQWMRTIGGITNSKDVTVKSKDKLTFDVEHREGGTLLKSARDLSPLEAQLMLAEDFEMTVDAAGRILDHAVDKDVTYRIYDSLSKQAYVTRVEGMEDWIQSYDPELQVRLDSPQQQILSTFTPRRPDQQSRYGDVYKRVPAENSKSGSALMPMEAVMSQSPEQLAQMSEAYDMPHIFDHGCVGQMATKSHNIVEQIKKYIPDLETGVDRYFRILFLLRYRPSDFEEIYGKDDLVEFEDDLTELASRAGEQLLHVLQQFEPGQYSSQEN